jgi:hypothetical protein
MTEIDITGDSLADITDVCDQILAGDMPNGNGMLPELTRAVKQLAERLQRVERLAAWAVQELVIPGARVASPQDGSTLGLARMALLRNRLLREAARVASTGASLDDLMPPGFWTEPLTPEMEQEVVTGDWD